MMKWTNKIFLLALLAILPLAAWADWSAPGTTFPSGQLSPFIHTGDESQIISGSFGVGGNVPIDDLIRAVGGLLITSNQVDTLDPAAKLDVRGQVKIRGGSPGIGKILTTDATGLAHWSDVASTPQITYFRVKKTAETDSAYATSKSIDAGEIASGVRIDLDWSATGASSCYASVSWSGEKELVDHEIVASPTASTVYLLTCQGMFTSVTAGVTVLVNGVVTTPPPPPSISTIKVKLVGDDFTTGTTPAGATASLDGGAPQSNAATFSNIAVGSHQIAVTKISGYTVTAGICTYTTTECFMPNSSDYTLSPGCSGGTCTLGVSASAGVITKVAFKYSSVTSYTLTTNATNGTITRSSNDSSYPALTVVTLTAVPNAGYTFTGWSSDLTGTTNPKNLTMNANKTVTANFILTPPFDFALSGNIPTQLPPSGGTPTIIAGSQISGPLTATFSSGTAQVVTFTSSLPSGFSGGVPAPNYCTPTCTKTMIINVPYSAFGPYNLTMTGTAAGGGTHTINFPINVVHHAPTISLAWDASNYLQLNWSVGNYPVSCTASESFGTSDNWSGPKAITSGTELIHNYADGSTRQFSLTCSNDTGSQTITREVTFDGLMASER